MYTIKSRFIETPSRKLAKLDHDLTGDGDALQEFDATLYSFEPEEIKDSDLRLTFKVYQDEADKIDKKQVEEFYLSAGAKSVDIRLVRVPRENVRSKTILSLKTLRGKLIENASIKGETVPQGVLDKADLLEGVTSEEVIELITKGGEIHEEYKAQA